MTTSKVSESFADIGHNSSAHTEISQIIERIAISSVKVPSKSVKLTSPEAIGLCARNIAKFNQPGPILVTSDNTVISGVEFLLAAKELGWSQIDVVRKTNLSEIDIKIHMLWLAKVPTLSEWDKETLHHFFEEIVSFDSDLIDLTGFSMGEIDVILDNETSDNATDPLDEFPELPDGNGATSKPGDLYFLGKHRLICGDSMVSETYARLMSGTVARAVVTDPPFNIPIANNASGLGKIKHEDFKMAAGEMSFEQFTQFLTTIFELCKPGIIAGGLIFAFMDRRHLEELFLAARKSDLKILDLCIWDKLSGGMGGLYRSQHEPCVVLKHGDQPHTNNVRLGQYGRNRTNVWKHRGLSSFGKGRDELLAAHPTVKPVNLLADIIKDCTKRGDIVLDPFMGSGSTILAAEKTGRRCFAIELDVKYVDVTIQRWEKMTGKAAVHVDSGLTFTSLKVKRLAAASTEHTSPAASIAGTDRGK